MRQQLGFPARPLVPPPEFSDLSREEDEEIPHDQKEFQARMARARCGFARFAATTHYAGKAVLSDSQRVRLVT